MFRLIRQVFIASLSFSGSLASIANAPDHIKCISLNNQQCLTQPTPINLNPNEYIEGLCYHPFVVSLDRCMEVVILLMIYPINYVFQTKQKI